MVLPFTSSELKVNGDQNIFWHYDKHKLMVRGEIAGFEKPLLRRNYRVLLKTPERQPRVICDFYPPEKFNAVFTADHGAELVGLIGETRVPLAKTGDIVLVQGVCRGWHDGVVMISAAEMRRVSRMRSARKL